jgi:CxxC-x17-CxxC domain-containing protein
MALMFDVSPCYTTGQVFDDICMKQFNRGGGYDRGGRGDRGFGGGGGGRGDRGFDKQMFPATCADCGNRCEVPFKPTNNKPVLCNDCFRGSDRGNDRGPRPERRNDRFSRDERPQRDNNRGNDQMEQINAKLDMIIKEIANLKQPNKVHTLDPEDASKLAEEKPAKKAKKAKKEASEDLPEMIAEEKPAKKKAKKAEKKPAKKTAKKAKK